MPGGAKHRASPSASPHSYHWLPQLSISATYKSTANARTQNCSSSQIFNYTTLYQTNPGLPQHSVSDLAQRRHSACFHKPWSPNYTLSVSNKWPQQSSRKIRVLHHASPHSPKTEASLLLDKTKCFNHLPATEFSSNHRENGAELGPCSGRTAPPPLPLKAQHDLPLAAAADCSAASKAAVTLWPLGQLSSLSPSFSVCSPQK